MPHSAMALIGRLQRFINIVHNPVSGWVILCISLLLTFAAYWFTDRQVVARAEEHFLYRAHDITHSIRQRMMLYEQALHGGKGMFSASEFVVHDEWRRYTEALDLSERLPGIQGFGFAAVVSAQDKKNHEEIIRAQGFPDYVIYPDGQRDFYTSVLYLEPRDWRNKRALGYDMWVDDTRREAMIRARDYGKPIATGAITLVQEIQRNVQRGFIIYVPLYETSDVPETLEARQRLLRGWIFAPFRIGDLLSGILGETDLDISLSIFDREFSGKETLLLRFGMSGVEETGFIANEPMFHTQIPLEILGRQWNINFRAPKQTLVNQQNSNQPLYVLVAGILVDLLLFYVLLSLHYINRHVRHTQNKLQQDFVLNRQHLEEQTLLVEASEQESRIFFELAPAAFLVISSKGIIVRANRHAHQLFGFFDNSLIGRKIEDLVPDDLRLSQLETRVDYLRAPASRTLDPARTFMAKKCSGDFFPTSISFVPADLRGETHVVAVVHDLSTQKQIEQTMAEAKERAESANRAKSEFLANMSHEIRTPLNAVLGAAQLLEKTGFNEDQQRYIRMIKSSGESLLGIINDILDFSKIEAGRMEMTQIPFDLDEVLARVAMLMSVNAGEKELELVVFVGANVNRQLQGDPLRLQQVLINLVSNAIKFTQKGEVVLSIETDDAQSKSFQKLFFSVRDTGIGMTPPQQARIFEAFSQADASITRRFGGTGLGLVISSKIVEHMGGRLHVVSEASVGSEFSFEIMFPLAASKKDVLFKPSGEAKRVLLLEKHEETIRAVTAIADYWGWSLATELNAKVEKGPSFDVVLISCAFLKENTESVETLFHNLPLSLSARKLLLVSDNQTSLTLTQEVQALFDTVVVKPVLTSSLWLALKEVDGKEIQGNWQSPKIGQLSGVRILLVEDNPFNQMVAEGLLSDMGASTSIVNNGVEALAVMSKNPDAFDVILMDIQMPLMDGVTATVKMREQGYSLPIIAMTAGVLASERERYLAVGMNDLVPKPIDAQQLWHSISLARAGSLACPLPNVEKEYAFLSIFNAQRLEKLVKGKPSRMQSILSSLTSIELEGPVTLKDSLSFIQQGNIEAAKKKLHSLKGVLSNYGGEKVAQEIQNLEMDVEFKESLSVISNRVSNIETMLNEYFFEARKWAAQNKL